MTRSQVLAIAVSASLTTLLVLACGESGTGVDATSLGEDSGATGRPDTGSGTAVPPTADSGSPEAGPVTFPTDGGLPTLSTLALDFGQIDCGTTGKAQTFVLQNPGNLDLPWSGSLGRGGSSPFTMTPASGTLRPGEPVTITVAPKPIPAAASTAANAFGDVITMSLGGTLASVELALTAHGAVLGYSPSPLPFGNAPVGGVPAQADFAVANSGNAPAAIALSATGDPAFAIVGATNVTANPGSTASKVSFAPTELTGYSGGVSMAVDAAVPLCAPVPANMTLSGTGTNDVVSVTPPSILFGNNGLVDCSATAPSQKVRITNSSNAAVTYGATLDHGSSLFTISPPSGTVPAASFLDLTVTPKAIPSSSATTPEAFSDNLTVTTSAAGDAPHVIALHQTAHGAILNRSTDSIGFSNVAIGRTVSTQFSFANLGNVDVTVKLQNGLSEFTQTSPVTVSAAGFAAPNVGFTPSGQQPFSDLGTVTMQTTVPLCGPLPGTLSLSGTGVSPSIGAQPSSFSFGFVPCGTAATPLNVKVTNNGPDTTYTASMEKGALRFTVAPATGSIPAGGFVDLTVTPLPIPQTSPVSANAFGDVLDVLSGNGNLSVNLTMTAQGAILDYDGFTTKDFGQLIAPATASQAITVRNIGNLDASVTFHATTSTTPADVFSINLASAAMTAGTAATVDVLFTPPIGTSTDEGTFYASTSAVLCNPLPAPITLSGASN